MGLMLFIRKMSNDDMNYCLTVIEQKALTSKVEDECELKKAKSVVINAGKNLAHYLVLPLRGN